MNEDLGKELNWDSTITSDGNDMEPLPEGIYDFTVRTVERARFEGSERMCPCWIARLDLVTIDKDGIERHIFDSLYLNTKAEWRLGQFFLAVGQKKKGEKTAMNWTSVPGAKVRAEITVNEYTDKNGVKRKNNRVAKYLEPEQKKWTAGTF